MLISAGMKGLAVAFVALVVRATALSLAIAAFVIGTLIVGTSLSAMSAPPAYAGHVTACVEGDAASGPTASTDVVADAGPCLVSR